MVILLYNYGSGCSGGCYHTLQVKTNLGLQPVEQTYGTNSGSPADNFDCFTYKIPTFAL